MNPQIKQTGLKNKVYIHDSPDKCALLIQPAVRSSFKPWGSYSTKRRARACAPHTLRQAWGEHAGNGFTISLPDKQEAILCLGKNCYMTSSGRRKVSDLWKCSVNSWQPPREESRLRLGCPSTASVSRNEMASVATGVAHRHNTRLCRWNWV